MQRYPTIDLREHTCGRRDLIPSRDIRVVLLRRKDRRRAAVFAAAPFPIMFALGFLVGGPMGMSLTFALMPFSMPFVFGFSGLYRQGYDDTAWLRDRERWRREAEHIARNRRQRQLEHGRLPKDVASRLRNR